MELLFGQRRPHFLISCPRTKIFVRRDMKRAQDKRCSSLSPHLTCFAQRISSVNYAKSLVPLGDPFEVLNPHAAAGSLAFGQGLPSSVGANHTLEQVTGLLSLPLPLLLLRCLKMQEVTSRPYSLPQVPGLYEGRPERYYDNQSDPRLRTGGRALDSQHTRDVRRRRR